MSTGSNHWKYLKILKLTGGNIDFTIYTRYKERNCSLIKGKLAVCRLEDSSLWRILFNEEPLAEFGHFKIGGRIINKVRFIDDMAIIAKTQKSATRYDEKID